MSSRKKYSVNRNSITFIKNLILVSSFIKREQEYRKIMGDIRNEITLRSSDPFGALSQTHEEEEQDSE